MASNVVITCDITEILLYCIVFLAQVWKQKKIWHLISRILDIKKLIQLQTNI